MESESSEDDAMDVEETSPPSATKVDPVKAKEEEEENNNDETQPKDLEEKKKD